MTPIKIFPIVYIVILNWNRLDDTLECIESISTLYYPNFKIIVVDNGSKENSPDIINEKYKDVILIKNKENLGFAEGNNVGIRYALSKDAKYIWLLNNDTVVDQNALTAMIEIGESIPECGIMGSKIYYYDKPELIWFAGATINWKKAISNHIGQNQKDSPQYDILHEMERVTGCSMLVKKEVCERIGLMDDSLFLYAEELDWCVRARKAGYKILYVPSSIIYHKVSISTGKDFDIVFNYFNTRNFLYVIKKNMSFPKREYYLINAIFHRLKECKVILKEIIKPKYWSGTKTLTIHTSKLRGVYDFAIGRMGKGIFKDLL